MSVIMLILYLAKTNEPTINKPVCSPRRMMNINEPVKRHRPPSPTRDSSLTTCHSTAVAQGARCQHAHLRARHMSSGTAMWLPDLTGNARCPGCRACVLPSSGTCLEGGQGAVLSHLGSGRRSFYGIFAVAWACRGISGDTW